MIFDDEVIRRKKNKLNKELIKLQQQMKQVVTTKDERYIELSFFEKTKCVLVEETEMLFKLELLGAESPITFTCELLDNPKADLVMYLSTRHAEPSEKAHQRKVERMKTFKFLAHKKEAFFGADDVCYIMMRSNLGCTLSISSFSNNIRALALPEKIKEFNKALTQTELAAEEIAAKKKD